MGALLGRLEAQGRELGGLQRHQTQARKLTATLDSATTALETSQADLQQTASALERTQHQLAQACAAAGLQSTPAFSSHCLCWCYLGGHTLRVVAERCVMHQEECRGW